MMLNVMILEDCLESREALEAVIRGISADIHVFSASRYEEAKELLNQNLYFALFFLDINLKPEKDTSGLLFAKELRQIRGYEFTPIIFITSVAELEIPSYRETSCYRFLIKPYQPQEVIKIVRDALRDQNRQEESQITVKKEGVNYRIRTMEIRCLKAVPHGVELLLEKEIVLAKYVSLKQMLKELNPEQFVQCHRMFVVNTRYIEYVDLVNGLIQLRGIAEPVEIGVTYKSRMRSLLK